MTIQQENTDRNTVSTASELSDHTVCAWIMSVINYRRVSVNISVMSRKTCSYTRAAAGGFHSCLCSFSQDILNHVLDDLELFVGKMSAAVNAPSQREDKSNKKGVFKKKKTKNNGNILSPVHLSTHVITGDLL